MFLDHETSRWIGWSSFWQRIQPATPMGKRIKEDQQRIPLLLKGKANWDEELDAIERWVRRYENDRAAFERMQTWIQRIPCVDSLLNGWQTGSWMTITDGLLLKSFLLDAYRLIEHLTGEEEESKWIPQLEQILLMIDPSGQRLSRFQISDFLQADDRMMWQSHHRMIQQKAAKAREERKKLEEAEGVLFSMDEEVYLTKSEGDRISVWKQDPRWLWQRETPFEVVFKRQSTLIEKQMDKTIAECRLQMDLIQKKVLGELTELIRPFIPFISQMSGQIGQWDWQMCKATLAIQWKGVRPKQGSEMEIIGARHEEMIDHWKSSDHGFGFTPLDVKLEKGVTLLTGANMSGKSLALSTIGWITALAYYGFYVPANSCTVPPIQAIRFIGESDDSIGSGWSSFGAQMKKIAESIVVSETALFLWDEPARGTRPEEGEALAVGLVRAMRSLPHITVMVTHFSRPCLEDSVTVYRVRGLSTWLREMEHIGETGWMEEIVRWSKADWSQRMDYRLELWNGLDGLLSLEGEALQMAGWLGMPDEVITYAKQWLEQQRR